MKLRFIDFVGIPVEGLLMIALWNCSLIFGVPIGYEVLSPCIRLRLEKTLIAQVVKEILHTLWNSKCVVCSEDTANGPYPDLIDYFTSSHSFSVTSILILSYHMLVFQVILLASVFLLKSVYIYIYIYIYLISLNNVTCQAPPFLILPYYQFLWKKVLMLLIM
jgi:hypothetical protein